MKVLFLNGSPHKDGCGARALKEMQSIFEAEGIETETVHVGAMNIHGCKACLACYKLGKCVFDDVVNEIAEKFEGADGLVVSSPIYYAAPNATLVALLDRMFYSSAFDKTMKVGASVAVARRGGLTATYDELNKYFGLTGMPIATSQYWNGVHGREKGQAEQDIEGLQTMRTLARNMTFLMRGIALAKEKHGLPEKEEWQTTHFTR